MLCCWISIIAFSGACSAVGFSLLPPRCHRLEKYLANGSCENTSLSRYLTLGILSSFGASSVNESTANTSTKLIGCNIHICACIHIDLVAVIRRPCIVSLLRQVFRFSLPLPGALSASWLISHLDNKTSTHELYECTMSCVYTHVHVQQLI